MKINLVKLYYDKKRKAINVPPKCIDIFDRIENDSSILENHNIIQTFIIKNLLSI